jgi:hypothetical protein
MGSLRPSVGQPPDPLRWRHTLLLVAVVSAGAITGACRSESAVTTAPSQVKCQVALAAASSIIGADGGAGTITVTTSPECPWEVSTGASWLSGLTPSAGQGAGTVEFRVAPNPLPAVREGDILVNDNRLRVSQQAAACRLELGSNSLALAAGGGTRDVAVSAPGGCTWTAATDASWISFTTPATGSGDGSIGVRIAPHDGTERRVGTILVGDQRVSVTQEADGPAAACVYSISSTSQGVVPSAGAEVSASVTVASGCGWSASSSVTWITVLAGASGTGTGTVAFGVAANTGGVRSAIVIVAGQTFTVTQAAATSTTCTYAIGSTAASIAAAGGSGTVAVSTGAGCAWTASSNAPWMTVTSGASAAGNGAVAFSVAPNTGAARSGTLSIAGQTFTVNQLAAPPVCAYAISPSEAALAAAGGSGTIAVTAGEGCNWTASSGAAWLTVVAAAGGSGNGAVAFSVAPNPGAARTAVIVVAAQTFTVNQAAAPAPCTYSIAPANASIGVLGGIGTVAVTAGAGCSWTANSTANWVTVTSGASGTGNGSIRFSVTPNLGNARTGTIEVAGQTFTVTQAALLSLPDADGNRRAHVEAMRQPRAWPWTGVVSH